MLAKRVIPCLDVKEGRVVKGTNFIGLRDAGDPVELAAFYDREGADEVVFLDIAASAEGRKTIIDVVRRTADQVFIPLTVGGGISTVEDIRAILGAGADKVSVNTAAVRNPRLITEGAERFGTQCIVVAIDARRRSLPVGQPPAWEVYVHGGRTPTDIDAVEWAVEAERLGAGEILLTSMDADGTLGGYDNELLGELSRRLTIPLIASGGAGSLQHLAEAVLIGGADAVLAASIFHYGAHTVAEAKAYIHSRGIPVRLTTTSVTTTSMAGSSSSGGHGSGHVDRSGLVGLKFGPDDLIPAVAQDAKTGRILMLAYMNSESLRKTLETGNAWYWSRERKRLWMKGEESGNVQHVRSVVADCDQDAVLLSIEQTGSGACHEGYPSCFHYPVRSTGSEAAADLDTPVEVLASVEAVHPACPRSEDSGILDILYQVILDRKANPESSSYTAYLFREGLDKILKKVGEEAAEVIIAAKGAAEPPEAHRSTSTSARPASPLAGEVADLIYHLLVLLAERGITPADVFQVLEGRRPDAAPKPAGHGKQNRADSGEKQ